MSFHLSAEEGSIRVEGENILKGRLRDVSGDYHDAHINLDEFIGNVDGHFVWDGENFSQSAENVHFAIEGGGEVPVLRATLRDAEGNSHERDLNLAERVSNQNGQFVFN